MLTVDGRCTCNSCEQRTGDIYRMVGACSNCGTRDVLMLFRAGDRAFSLKCPVCRNTRSVQPIRLATPDEIPTTKEPSRE